MRFWENPPLTNLVSTLFESESGFVRRTLPLSLCGYSAVFCVLVRLVVLMPPYMSR